MARPSPGAWIAGWLAVTLAACSTAPPSEPPPARHGPPLLGWTHERGSPDRMTDPVQQRLAMDLLRSHASVQNAQILGWGLPSPMPSPGVDDFTALDRRVAMMLASGSLPVITLCCAPEWMKDDAPGTDPQTRFEQTPARNRQADFAALAARIAARYPQVRHFLVWNELKGYWDGQRQRWDIERYTEKYRQVRTAIKAVRPDALVGGPYIVMDSHRAGSPGARQFGSEVSGPWGTLDRRSLDALRHWLDHHGGADFVAVDGGVMPRDGQLDVSPTQALEKFVAVQRWLRQHTALPIWWAEWYPVPPSMGDADALRQIDAALALLAPDPPAVLLFWDPSCPAAPSYGRGGCLWRQQGRQIEPAGLGRRAARHTPPH